MRQRIFSNNRKGFSLLELLVVISIIGILIAVGVVAFSTAQKKGRDARRRSDIKVLQDGFEQYYSENLTYDDCALMTADTTLFPGGAPVDPKGGEFVYACGGDATGYCVCAELEGGAGNGQPNGTTCLFPGTATHYCLTNLQ